MSMNLNLGVRAIGALGYVLLFAFTGGAGVNAHDGQAITTISVLLGMALCGAVTGILGAGIVQETERVIRKAQRKRFAAAAATALPTVGVRLSSSDAPQLLIFSQYTPAAKPLVHV